MDGEAGDRKRVTGETTGPATPKPQAEPAPQKPSGGTPRGGSPQKARRPRRGDRPGGPRPRPGWDNPEFLANAVEKGLNREFVQTAERFARDIGRSVPHSPLRKVCGEVLRMELEGLEHSSERLLLLKPRLACEAAREGSAAMKSFRRVVEGGVDKILEVDGEERADRFRRFRGGLETILSYLRIHVQRQRNWHER